MLLLIIALAIFLVLIAIVTLYLRHLAKHSPSIADSDYNTKIKRTLSGDSAYNKPTSL
jgi:hypothetical protein